MDLRAQAQMVKVLCEHGADVVQRDSFRNLPMHLACAVDSTSMVEHLCEEGSKFDAPWINQSEQSPLSIARPKCKAFLLSRKANLQRQREERVALLMSAESVPTTIDSMISKVTLDDLLGTQAGNGSGAPQLRDKMPSVTAQEGTAPHLAAHRRRLKVCMRRSSLRRHATLRRLSSAGGCLCPHANRAATIGLWWHSPACSSSTDVSLRSCGKAWLSTCPSRGTEDDAVASDGSRPGESSRRLLLLDCSLRKAASSCPLDAACASA